MEFIVLYIPKMIFDWLFTRFYNNYHFNLQIKQSFKKIIFIFFWLQNIVVLIMIITTRKSSYCDGCENCCYISYIAVLFWLAPVDDIYCGISLDRCNISSLLQRTTMALYKPLQYTCFSGVRISYSGAP